MLAVSVVCLAVKEATRRSFVSSPFQSALCAENLIEREDHIVAMSANQQGSTKQYHGPPNQPRDIVSSNKP